MLLAFALAALVAQAPAPSPSPLKEIIRVKSSALCTAIHDRIGPSVAALMQNDNAIANGTHYVFEMGRDDGRPWMRMDELHLEYDVSKIVRNLEAVYSLIEVASADAASADGKDHSAIEQLKNKLRAVADAQRAELNLLDGTLESQQLAEIVNSDLPAGLATTGFDLAKLNGDEIRSDSAPFGSQALNGTPPPSGDDSIPLNGNATASKQTQAGVIAPNRNAQPAGDARGSGDRFGGPELQAVAGIRTTQRIENEFIRDLLPLADGCDRLTTPPKLTPP